MVGRSHEGGVLGDDKIYDLHFFDDPKPTDNPILQGPP